MAKEGDKEELAQIKKYALEQGHIVAHDNLILELRNIFSSSTNSDEIARRARELLELMEARSWDEALVATSQRAGSPKGGALLQTSQKKSRVPKRKTG
jgi:hypothetical protein